LKRYTSPGGSFEKKFDEGHNAEVRQWLMKLEKLVKRKSCVFFLHNNIVYRRNNKRSSNLDSLETTPKKSRFKREEPPSYNSPNSTYILPSDGMENSPKSELDDNISVNSENFENGQGVSSPRTSLHNFELSKGPKKRWLQAVQDQQLLDSSQDLARPINWGEDGPSSDGDEVKIEPVTLADEYVAVEPQVAAENQKRPTVLVCVQGGKSKQITSDDMQGAIALVELKNGQKSCVNYNYRL
jgi:hypothetical protein